MGSQTRDGTDAIPRRKRCFPLLKLFGQGYDYENARNYPRQPWDATPDEVRASRGAIAESGGKEGGYAIRIVCHDLPPFFGGGKRRGRREGMTAGAYANVRQ